MRVELERPACIAAVRFNYGRPSSLVSHVFALEYGNTLFRSRLFLLIILIAYAYGTHAEGKP